jgi:NAD(P)-dependent dehydrogenase (short-subunit alcohol dehydrogenase family)
LGASTLLASYAISKAAAWSFTNSTRQWLSKFNVHVMGVHVGFIDTDLTQSLDIPKFLHIQWRNTYLMELNKMPLKCWLGIYPTTQTRSNCNPPSYIKH